MERRKTTGNARRSRWTDHDNDALVTRVQEGDWSAYAELYTRHFPMVCRYARCIICDEREAEDVAQEVFMSALRVLPAFEVRPERPFSAFLLCVTRNRALDHRRKLMRLHAEAPEEVSRLREGVQAPSTVTAGWITDAELSEIVESLPKIQRQALLLRFVGGFAHEDVGRALALTPQASRNVQHRALASVRARVQALRQRSAQPRSRPPAPSAGGEVVARSDPRLTPARAGDPSS